MYVHAEAHAGRGTHGRAHQRRPRPRLSQRHAAVSQRGMGDHPSDRLRWSAGPRSGSQQPADRRPQRDVQSWSGRRAVGQWLVVDHREHEWIVLRPQLLGCSADVLADVAADGGLSQAERPRHRRRAGQRRRRQSGTDRRRRSIPRRVDESSVVGAANNLVQWIIHTPVAPAINGNVASWRTAGGQPVSVTTLYSGASNAVALPESAVLDCRPTNRSR